MSSDRFFGSRAVRTIAILGAAGLAIAACGSSGNSGTGGASGGTKSSAPYVIGDITSTNPAAQAFEWWRKGVLAYFDQTNATGGVHGHKVSMVVEDDANFDTQTEVSFFNELQQDHALAVLGLTLDSSIPVVAAKAVAAHIPIMLGSGAEHAVVTPPKQYEYGSSPDFQQDLATMAEAASQAGVKKAAIIEIDSAESREAAAFAQQNFQSKYGIKIVSTQYTPLTATDFTTQVQAAQQAGAQSIMMIQSPSDGLLIVRAMQAQKFSVPIYGTCGSPEEISAILKLGASCVGVSPTQTSTSLPGYKAAAQAAQKFGLSSALTAGGASFLNGWVAGETIVKALSICGASCTTGEQLNAALQKVSGLNTGGLTAPVTLSETNHSVINTQYWTVKNGAATTGPGVESAP
jgi:branched-chain amino acid transport system substrate-binding protein